MANDFGTPEKYSPPFLDNRLSSPYNKYRLSSPLLD